MIARSNSMQVRADAVEVLQITTLTLLPTLKWHWYSVASGHTSTQNNQVTQVTGYTYMSSFEKNYPMSVIKLPLLYVGLLGENHLYTLFDSGANLSCINPEKLKDIETPVGLGRIRRLATASEGHFIEITQVVRLDFYIHDILLSDEFLV